jgi:hypothetical protein
MNDRQQSPSTEGADTQNHVDKLEDLQQRLDILEEEFYLPDIIEEIHEPAATSVSSDRARHLGAAKVRQYRKIELVESSEKNITKMTLDIIVITMFAFSCYLLYNSIIWTIWG